MFSFHFKLYIFVISINLNYSYWKFSPFRSNNFQWFLNDKVVCKIYDFNDFLGTLSNPANFSQTHKLKN